MTRCINIPSIGRIFADIGRGLRLRTSLFALGLTLAGCSDPATVGHAAKAPTDLLSIAPPITAALLEAPPLPARSGQLRAFVRSLPIMRVESHAYSRPDENQRASAREALRLLLAGQREAARQRLATIGFELFRLDAGNRHYLVIQETPRPRMKGWTFLAINPAGRRPLLLEAPHPRHDRLTGNQAVDYMVELDARALLLSTTYRCASARASRCSGRTSACRARTRRGRYRASDAAHIASSFFEAFHETLMSEDRKLVAVQLHGFARRPSRRVHVMVSDGTRLPGSRRSFANRLARLLRRMSGRRRAVRSCNERNNRGWLCGIQNVQGRFVNGSRDPCRRRARRSTNRFLHIEQSASARRAGHPLSPALLRRALGQLFPANGPADFAAARGREIVTASTVQSR